MHISIKKTVSKMIRYSLFIKYYLFTIRLSPDISAGTSNPITVSIVGAISASLPSFKVYPSVLLDTHTNGTGSVVCAVNGFPVSASIIVSAFPWSAVINTVPSNSKT